MFRSGQPSSRKSSRRVRDQIDGSEGQVFLKFVRPCEGQKAPVMRHERNTRALLGFFCRANGDAAFEVIKANDFRQHINGQPVGDQFLGSDPMARASFN